MSQLAQPVAAPSLETTDPIVHKLRQRFVSLEERGMPTQPFSVRLEDGTPYPVGGGESAFTIGIVNDQGRQDLGSLDELSIAEAYMLGDLDIDGEMLAALRFRPMLSDRRPLHYLWQTYLQPWIFGQESRDERWISSHYDIDPDFFVLWLDSEIRAYSHGHFASDDESLEAGMLRKFQYAFDATGMKPGWKVLDIGGGWGSFQEFAGEKGVHVTSLTISAESEGYMNRLIEERGYPGRAIRQHLLAWETDEKFDAIVNLGVTEHLPDYRRTLARYQRLLKPGRRIYLDAYSGNRHGMPSFISKWVFEGNTSPLNLERYLHELASTPFELMEIINDRHNYYLSCKKWAENLEAVEEEVVERWGEHLFRRFRLYLWAAANSFRNGTLEAHRMVLELPEAAG
ncbi:MAG: class I SAM-dependent methyltransferase [Holophagales bacterium]|nr:class I SAM-dependent methyltransferase [Holophagales bacterium]